jgi:hypothetical protein
MHAIPFSRPPAVLIANPCPAVRRLWELSLRLRGVCAVTAADGGEAADLLRWHGPAIRAALLGEETPGLAEALAAMRHATTEDRPCLLTASIGEATAALRGHRPWRAPRKPVRLGGHRSAV